MIEYVFTVDRNHRITFPISHWTKYKAYKYLKQQYPNSVISYFGKHCDDIQCNKLNDLINDQVRLTALKDKLFNEISCKLPNLDYDTKCKVFFYRDLVCELNRLKHEIRQLEFRLS